MQTEQRSWFTRAEKPGFLLFSFIQKRNPCPFPASHGDLRHTKEVIPEYTGQIFPNIRENTTPLFSI
jgi:hypothetical protein